MFNAGKTTGFCQSAFVVAADYKVNKKISIDEDFGHEIVEPVIMAMGGQRRVFKPDERFYAAFLKLNYHDTPSVLEFCREYGIPALPHDEQIYARAGTISFENLLKPRLIERIDLGELQARIGKFRQALELWHAIMGDLPPKVLDKYLLDFEAFDLPVDWHVGQAPKDTDPQIIEMIASDYKKSQEYRAWDQTRDDAEIKKANQYLSYFITVNLTGVVLGVIPLMGIPLDAVAVRSPIDYVWLKFKHDFIGRKEYRACISNPEHLFLPSRDGQLFCPKTGNEKRSSCENNYGTNTRKKRSRILQLYAQGHTVNDIASKTKVHPVYLKQCLEKWLKKGRGKNAKQD